jgi:hypothetical protein
MAMSLFGCGQRKVWFDPAAIRKIALAKSRADIRALIADGHIVDRSRYTKRVEFARESFVDGGIFSGNSGKTFSEKWMERPIRARLWHQLPSRNRRMKRS